VVDEYKKAVQANRQKTAYTAVGVAVLIHLLFVLSKWAAIAVGLAGVGVLLYALYAATTGKRMSMSVAFFLAVGLHVGVFVYDHLFGIGVSEERAELIIFRAPPPILEKNFDLAKRPEISEVQMEMLQSMAPPDLPQDISAIADVSAVGSDLLSSVLPGTQVLGAFSGAKAEELAFDEVEMIELSETSAPVQEAMSMRMELMNVGDLDIGRYQAILIQDPDNKRNIHGSYRRCHNRLLSY